MNADHDRWRYACPKGHVSWSLESTHIYCNGCRQTHRSLEESQHNVLIDKRTGERIPFTAIELRHSAGEKDTELVAGEQA